MSLSGSRRVHAAATRVLGGNEPLLLDGRNSWTVVSGSLAIFMLSADNGIERAARRHLFSIEAGETVFWTLLQRGQRTFAAIPVERTEVAPTTLSAEVRSIADGEPDARKRFNRWVEVLSGEARAAGAAVAGEPSDASTTDTVTACLDRLQTLLLDAVERQDRQRGEEQRRRFHERQRLNARLTADTISGLAAVARLGAVQETVTWDESPLFAAARRVGEACGITMQAPTMSVKSRSALDSILDASNARSRRVLLSGTWWKQDSGPLLAYLAEGNAPVALLPERRSLFRGPRYRLVSDSGDSVAVDHAIASTLSPVAFVLYASLPDRVSVGELFRSALTSGSREVTVAVFAAIATTLLGMLTPQATNILFENAIPDADRLMLVQIGAALFAASAGALLFDLAQAVAMVRLTTTTASTLQTGVWDRLLRQSPSFFRRFTAGDLENRADAVTYIRFALNETVIMSVLGSVISLLNFGLMTYYSPALAIVAAVIAGIVLIVNALSGRSMSRIVRPLQEVDGQLTGLMVQLINAVPKLRIAGAETRAFAQWGNAYSRKQKLKQDLQIHSDRVRLFGLLLAPAATATLYWFAYDSLFRGAGPSQLTLGSFIAFSAAFGTFLTGAATLGDSSAMLLTVAAMWKRMSPILETEPEVHSHKNSPGQLTGQVRLDHVTFRYREDGPLTLEDISIHAAAGECIAIVGPSGSGKSTIINLLLRFESPSAGAVYYDNHDLNSLDVLAVRRQLGVVTQENKLLAGSIYDNITCGSLSTMDDAWEAARAAGLAEDIEQMPMGLHTIISEGGGNISGGQRQRLLIARALVQKPRILILDEATSALDNRTQAIVTESLNKLKVTRIIVAHRLSTIRQADRIYVLQGGRIVQQGAFDALMSQEGLFLRLMQRQMT